MFIVYLFQGTRHLLVSHPSGISISVNRGFMLPVNESFCKKQGSILCYKKPPFSSPARDDRLIALRPGHSSSELCLLFSAHLLTHTHLKVAECHYKRAPLQVPNERGFLSHCSFPWMNPFVVIFFFMSNTVTI